MMTLANVTGPTLDKDIRREDYKDMTKFSSLSPPFALYFSFQLFLLPPLKDSKMKEIDREGWSFFT